MPPKVQISTLTNRGDDRGDSFALLPEALQFLGDLADAHFSSILPGAVRGNHFHQRKREAIVVLHNFPWSFHWNDCASTLSPAAFTPEPYDPKETVARKDV